MIKELTNFVNDLPPAVFSYNLQLEEGLYFEIDFDDEGEPNLLNQEAHAINLKKVESDDHEQTKLKKKEKQKETPKELSEFLTRCLSLQTVSKHEFQVNQCFNSSEKIFIQTASPFAIGFKKEAIEGKITDRPKLQKAVENYFKRANDFIKPENESHLTWLEKFQNFCTSDMIDWVRSQEIYERAPDKAVIRIYYAVPSFEDFKVVYDDYLNANALLNPDKETGMGISVMMSKFTSQKVFMAHKSAPFEVNFQVPTEVAKTLWQFFQIRKRILPNPLPIFIDKRELNGKMISVMNEDRKIPYSQIVKSLFEETSKGDLGSYYLLFFTRKGEVGDLDFVPTFRYHLDGMQITEIIPMGGKMAGKIDNVFEFERRVANKIFDGQLIVESTIWLKYFDAVEYDPKYMSHNTYNQLLKYRKGFYDYIYKSKQEAIQHHAFHDIMSRGILDFIHRDLGKDSKSDYDYTIKEKLNIWFSLYDYFNPSQSNKSDMVNKTQNLAARIQEIAKEGGEEVFRSDDEFAFASGQLIRLLLSKNESANRSHALLEPFLQKTEPGLFKLAIARAFDTYKHALKFYAGSKRYEFDKIMSIVMGYEPEPDTNMKDHLPLILAGYFAKSVFYSDNQADNSNTNA